MSSGHDGVTCDACSQRNFRLRRYKCLVCCDYDLCGTCFDNQCETNKHLRTHPMQCLIPQADHKLFYNGETSSEYTAQSFTCPLCGQLGFTETSFSRHVFQKHPSQEAGDTDVLCPLCATRVGSDPNTKIRFMARHLVTTHRLSAPSNGQNSQNHDSSGSTSADDFEKYTDSSRQQFTTRRLMPFFLSRTHRPPEGNRTRNSNTTQRRGRLYRFMDSSSTQNDSTATERSSNRDTNRSAQAPSSGSQGPSSSLRNVRLTTAGGRNSHNGGASGSSVQQTTTASSQVPSSDSAAAASTELGGRISLHDMSEKLRTLYRNDRQKIVDSGIDAEIATTTGSGSAETVDENNADIVAQSNVPANQDSPQRLPPHKSVSGDPTGKELTGAVSGRSADKETELPTTTDAVQSTTVSTPPAPMRDEFDSNWVAFLHELVWSSLYVTPSSSQAEDSFPTSG